MPVSDRGIISIGTSRVGLISHSEMKDLLAASPKLASVFWRETMIEATILREWLCNVGVDLADDAAAWNEAKRFVRDIEHGLEPGDNWHLEVCREGRPIYSLRIYTQAIV